MKTHVIPTGLAAVFTLGLVSSAFADLPTPILEYTFNDTDATSASTGSNTTAVAFRDSSYASANLHGTAGSGLTGLAGDIAFDNTASAGMGSASGASGGGGGVIGDIDSGSTGSDWLTSFTVQGWYYSSVQMGGAARILDKTSGSTSSFLLRGATTNGQMNLTVDNLSVDSGTGYTATGQWVFFAASYDGSLTSNNVKFYVGDTTTSVSLVSTGTVNSGLVSNNVVSMVLGNSSHNPSLADANNRPFDGLLDDIRLYGSASDSTGVLSLATLEAIRTSDISAVPEPSTYALLFGSVSLGIATFSTRRRKQK
ncbi:MAG: PEP-CTERM sorting domain-containing protein [Opitutaceae bacterium]|jgi:hypothetical protein